MAVLDSNRLRNSPSAAGHAERLYLDLAMRIVVLVALVWVIALGSSWLLGLWCSGFAAFVGYLVFGCSLFSLFAAGMILVAEVSAGVCRSTHRGRCLFAASLWLVDVAILVWIILHVVGGIGAA